jgi:hypothetical protein
LLAQLLEKPLACGGVALGSIQALLRLGFMRPLETLSDYPKEVVPALVFHLGTANPFRLPQVQKRCRAPSSKRSAPEGAG